MLHVGGSIAVSVSGGNSEYRMESLVFVEGRRFPHGGSRRCARVWLRWLVVGVPVEASEKFRFRKLKKTTSH